MTRRTTPAPPPRSVGFPPVARRDARVLVLGSLPGRMSLEQRRYYAQPRNAFWRIVESLFAIPIGLPYEERLARLARERVALWDVCAAAVRPGSLDSAIVHASIEANDFAGFFRTHRAIELVCCNGAKAADLYLRLVQPMLPPRAAALPLLRLPSTSPAHQTLSYAQKLAHWQVVRETATGAR